MKLTWQLLFVAILSLSFVACKSDKSNTVETSEAGDVKEEVGKSFTVDKSASTITWEGTKLAGAHMGTLGITDGSISVEDSKITGGSFTLDMNSINVTDLEGDEKAYLESHLKGSTDENADDFFNVKKYPTATFEITKVTNLINNEKGTNLVYGNLTMRDVTKQVSFHATIDMTDAAVKVSTNQFKIDRTEWGIKYNSDKFFDNLKDKAINDEMGIKISLIAKA